MDIKVIVKTSNFASDINLLRHIIDYSKHIKHDFFRLLTFFKILKNYTWLCNIFRDINFLLLVNINLIRIIWNF